MKGRHVEYVIGAEATHDCGHARSCRNRGHGFLDSEPAQVGKRLVVRGCRVEALEVEDFVGIDAVRREAVSVKGTFQIWPFPCQIADAFIDQRQRMHWLTPIEAFARNERDTGRIHAAGEVRRRSSAQARAYGSPQPVETLLAEPCDIIGARIGRVLEPIPVATPFHLAARQMETTEPDRTR